MRNIAPALSLIVIIQHSTMVQFSVAVYSVCTCTLLRTLLLGVWHLWIMLGAAITKEGVG